MAIELGKPRKLFFCDISLLNEGEYGRYLDKKIISIDITYGYLTVYLSGEEQ
jgi:hypothetical protein